MPSTYSNILRIEKIATSEQSGTWGATTNTNLELLEDAIAGVASVTHDDTANYTLTALNGATDEARCAILEIGGTLTAARNAVVPTQTKPYIVKNSTSGGFAVTIKTSGGTGVSIPNGKVGIVYCDGTNVVSGANYIGSTIDAIADLAVTDGNFVVGNGTTWVAESGATARTSMGAQAADADLTALAALASTGILARTAADTYSLRTIAAGTGISMANGDGVSGNPTVAVDEASAANIWAKTADKTLVNDTVWSALAPQALTSGTTITPDFQGAINFSLTIGHNATLANPSNAPVAGQSGVIVITQDGTGGRTLGYGSQYQFPSGNAPTLTTAASSVDVLHYYAKATNEILISTAYDWS